MNIKKLFALLAGVSLVAQTVVPSAGVFGATYSDELVDAYNWAHEKGVTTMDSIDNANMYGAITRAQMAKMLSVYAKGSLGKTPDTSKACSFNDIDSVKGDLHDFIIESCQLGIMGKGISSFRPYDTISRAEFGTALSRVLWDDANEGGTPYYAKHLDALKAEGIMTQIDNPENRDEVRGYVMLMLMRSDEWAAWIDCDDEMTQLACEMGSDECPAACRDNGEEEEDNKVVKSGDLAVTAKAAEWRKVLQTGISDLDTLTFKTSEDVEISRVTLELYGYSDNSSTAIKWVWLEDEDGNVIADSKTLTKDKVTLNIKKDYRHVDGSYVATIVVETDGASGTLWFKVTDVESTAKNLNVDNYNPYTYEVVAYTSSKVTIEVKGTAKNYNYEEGESYELARFKVKAGTKDVLIKGLTLTNALTSNDLDMEKFLDKLTVKADSEEIKSKVSVNKDDQLVISFSDDVELGMNKSILLVVSASFKDFDAYSDWVSYYLKDSADFNAVESKNSTRVGFATATSNDAFDSTSAKAHYFNGWKIKLSNTKLGNVDAAQASEDTVIAEGDITITEPLSKVSFKLPVNGNGAQYIETVTMVVNGDEYDASKVKYNAFKKATKYSVGAMWLLEDGKVYKVITAIETTDFPSADPTTAATTYFDLVWDAVYEFNNIDIEKSGKVQFKVDITDTGSEDGKFQFDPFGKSAFDGAKYDSANKPVNASNDVSGSITFSQVTIQTAKASLKGNDLKAIDFVENKTDTQTVFKGTYTAKKGGDVDLNKFYVTLTTAANVNWTATPATLGSNKVTFRLLLNGEEVADTDTLNSEETFSDYRVAAGESVEVEVKAEVEAYNGTAPKTAYKIWLYGTDTNGNEMTGEWKANTVEMSVKATAGIDVDKATADKNTITLRKANAVLASFSITPSNGNDSAQLDDIVLKVTKELATDEYLRASEVTLDIDGVETDVAGTDSAASSDPATTSNTITYTLGKDIEGKTLVTLSLDSAAAGEYTVELTKVNNTVSRQWTKKMVNAEVFITSAKASDSNNSSTVFTYEIGDKYDSSYIIKNLALFNGVDVSKITDCYDNTAGTLTTAAAKLTAAGFIEAKRWDIDTNKKTIEKVIDDTVTAPIMVNAVAYQVCGVNPANPTQCETVIVAWYDAYDDYLDYDGAQLRVYAYKK